MNWMKLGLAVLFDAALFTLMRLHGGFAAHFLFYLLSGAILYGLLFRYLALHALSVTRRLPLEAVWTGSEWKVEIEVRLRAWLPAPWLLVEDRWRDELRGRRLTHRKLLIPGFRRKAVYRYTIRDLPRGRYRYLPMEIQAGDFFGFVSHTWRLQIESEFMVHPSPLAIPGLRAGLLPGFGDEPGRLAPSREADYLRGIRDYHRGDPLNLIHWKSLARSGQPRTKEFERDVFPELTILPDICVAGDKAMERLDMTMHAAAGVARFCEQRGLACTLALGTGHAGTGGAERRMAVLDRQVCDELASAVPNPAGRYAEALLQLAAAGAGGTGGAGGSATLIGVTSQLDKPLVEAVREIHRLGGAVAMIFCSLSPALPWVDRQWLTRLEKSGCPVFAVTAPSGLRPEGGDRVGIA